MCHDTLVQGTEQLWAASVLSFHHVGSRDQTRVIKFGSKSFDSPRAPVQFLEMLQASYNNGQKFSEVF